MTGETILSRSNDPVPVETRLQIVLAVMSGEITIAEAARRHGVSTESINRWRNRFVDAGKAAMEDGMPGGKGAGRGNFVERRQRAEIQELKLALAEATVQLRIWQKGSEYIDQVPSQTSPKMKSQKASVPPVVLIQESKHAWKTRGYAVAGASPLTSMSN